jgi:hypothetical protein
MGCNQHFLSKIKWREREEKRHDKKRECDISLNDSTVWGNCLLRVCVCVCVCVLGCNIKYISYSHHWKKCLKNNQDNQPPTLEWGEDWQPNCYTACNKSEFHDTTLITPVMNLNLEVSQQPQSSPPGSSWPHCPVPAGLRAELIKVSYRPQCAWLHCL